MNMSVSRVVAFVVTPILTAASGVLTAWLAKHFPGFPHLDSQEVVVFGVAGSTAALSAALKWLHGSSLYERQVLALEAAAKRASMVAETVDPGVTARVEAAAVQQAGNLVQDAVHAINPTTSAKPAA